MTASRQCQPSKPVLTLVSRLTPSICSDVPPAVMAMFSIGSDLFAYPVVVVQNEHPGLVHLGLLGRQRYIGHDDDLVARLYQSCCRTVQADGTAAGLPFDHIGFEPLSIVDIHYADLLPDQDAALVEQILVDGDTAGIVEVGLRYGRLVKFCF